MAPTCRSSKRNLVQMEMVGYSFSSLLPIRHDGEGRHHKRSFARLQRVAGPIASKWAAAHSVQCKQPLASRLRARTGDGPANYPVRLSGQVQKSRRRQSRRVSVRAQSPRRREPCGRLCGVRHGRCRLPNGATDERERGPTAKSRSLEKMPVVPFSETTGRRTVTTQEYGCTTGQNRLSNRRRGGAREGDDVESELVCFLELPGSRDTKEPEGGANRQREPGQASVAESGGKR
jgi:hypothetical protein